MPSQTQGYIGSKYRYAPGQVKNGIAISLCIFQTIDMLWNFSVTVRINGTIGNSTCIQLFHGHLTFYQWMKVWQLYASVHCYLKLYFCCLGDSMKAYCSLEIALLSSTHISCSSFPALLLFWQLMNCGGCYGGNVNNRRLSNPKTLI